MHTVKNIAFVEQRAAELESNKSPPTLKIPSLPQLSPALAGLLSGPERALLFPEVQMCKSAEDERVVDRPRLEEEEEEEEVVVVVKEEAVPVAWQWWCGQHQQCTSAAHNSTSWTSPYPLANSRSFTSII